MSGITVSDTPPAEWSAVCTAGNFLFHSPDWLELLESSFNVRTQYIWDEEAQCGGAVSSFSAGGVSLTVIPLISREFPDRSRCRCVRLRYDRPDTTFSGRPGTIRLMSGITVSDTPPAEWSAVCTAGNFLFHSPDWLELLESSFNVRTQYIWDEEAQCGGAVSSFSAGPFQLGYLGFPFGGVVGNARVTAEILRRWQSRRSDLLPLAIRIPMSAFENSADLDLAYVSTPETAITDLPSWTLERASENHRRNVRKAMRSELEVTDASTAADGAETFKLYSDARSSDHRLAIVDA